jgi:hypothetical protein
MNTLLTGSLNEFGLVEVLQVMDMGNMTGALHLRHNTGRSGIIYFHQGKIANCVEFDAMALTLGNVLQQLRMATREQIDQAFAQQLQDVVGMRIGERLIHMGVITPQQLQEALRTKALWTLRELGLWQQGNYEFIASNDIQKLLPYGETSLDIEIMRTTLEMVSYADEWQQLRQSLPDGMRTVCEVAPTLSQPTNLPTRVMALVFLVKRGYNVRRIAIALRLPEMEVAREMAQLVQQQLLISRQHYEIPQPSTNSKQRFNLPDPAEKLRLEHFALFDLLSRMEQAWQNQRMPHEQLSALVEFINWTMDALAEACRANGTELDPNTLQMLLYRENLSRISSYSFNVVQNHIDAEDFDRLCRGILQGNMAKAEIFYKQASDVLLHILSSLFHSINARVASPRERMENQEVWEAMFEQFALSQ